MQIFNLLHKQKNVKRNPRVSVPNIHCSNIYQPLRTSRIWHKVNFFKAEFNRFEFRVFLLLDQLPHQGWRTQSALLFTHSWRENNWIHTFPMLCEMQSVSSRIWTCVAVSISNDDNHYTTGTSFNLSIYLSPHSSSWLRHFNLYFYQLNGFNPSATDIVSEFEALII